MEIQSIIKDLEPLVDKQINFREQFGKIADKAFREAEFEKFLGIDPWLKGETETKLKNKRDEYLSRCSTLIDKYTRTQQEIREIGWKIRKQSYTSNFPIFEKSYFILMSLLVTIIFVIALGKFLVLPGFTAIFMYLPARLLFILFLPLLIGAWWLFKFKRNKIQQIQMEVKKDLEYKFSLPEKLAELHGTLSNIFNYLANELIIPSLREIINEIKKDSFSNLLEDIPRPGLMDVHDPLYEVSTEAHGKLLDLIKEMRMGTIGISGPRGAGKTTIMESICNADKPETEGMRVYVSAPTQYDPRDFILHLFAKICKKVAPSSKFPPLYFRIPEFDNLIFFLIYLALVFFLLGLIGLGIQTLAHNAWSIYLLEILNQNVLHLMKWGIGLLGGSFLFKLIIPLILMVQHIEGIRIIDETFFLTKVCRPFESFTRSLNLIGVLLIILGLLGLASRPYLPAIDHVKAVSMDTRAIISPSNLPERAPQKKKISINEEAMQRFSNLLGQNALGLIFLAFYFTMTYLILVFLLVPFFKLLYIIRKEKSILEWASIIQKFKLEREDSKIDEGDIVSIDVYYKAQRILKDIQFQQSYSSGWKGSLHVSLLGLESSQTESLAQKQQTLPDIIEGFRSFINSLKRPVLIAIDEIDKIESTEKAEQFLNDIKSIFGIHNCLYVISVSQSAMSRFERRGLPKRDTFDSSFDAIVRVPPFNLNDSKLLLNRRVIFLPVPFRSLCHLISGGLPRDLIRSCRQLFTVRKRSLPPATDDSHPVHLNQILREMLRDEIRSKIEALYIEVKNFQTEEYLKEYLDALENLKMITSEKSLDLDRLGDQANRFWQMENVLNAIKDEQQNERAERQALLGFARELAVYIFYLITVLELLRVDAEAAEFPHKEIFNPENKVEQLAAVRQSLETNATVAFDTLRSLRQGMLKLSAVKWCQEGLVFPRLA
jgi:hypothetical protein